MKRLRVQADNNRGHLGRKMEAWRREKGADLPGLKPLPDAQSGAHADIGRMLRGGPG